MVWGKRNAFKMCIKMGECYKYVATPTHTVTWQLTIVPAYSEMSEKQQHNQWGAVQTLIQSKYWNGWWLIISNSANYRITLLKIFCSDGAILKKGLHVVNFQNYFASGAWSPLRSEEKFHKTRKMGTNFLHKHD